MSIGNGVRSKKPLVLCRSLLTFSHSFPCTIAFARQASDVFSSIAAFASGAPKIGIGTLVGAALFVSTVVVGAVATVSILCYPQLRSWRAKTWLLLPAGW